MAERKSLIRRIFSIIGGFFDVVRKTLFMLFLLVMGVSVYLAFKGGPPIKVEDGIAMVLVPYGQIVEQNDEDPREQVAQEIFGEDPQVTVLNDMLDAIDAAAADERIKLLFLKLDTGFSAGQAQLEELAAAIQRFKESDKPVYAWAPNLGQGEYYLAAQADKVFIDPMGMVFFTGFENYPLYFSDALAKLGVKINVFRVGEFKSAVEPFIRDSMSEAAKANAQGWLDGLWKGWREGVAQGRGITVEALQAYTDNYTEGLREHAGDPAQLAAQAGLVDEVMSLHEVRKQAGELVGFDEDHGSFRQINHRRYLHALHQQEHSLSTAEEGADGAKKWISTIVVQGEIAPGESGPGIAGGDTLRRLIDEVAEDEDSAALVLRVNSPGGSVFASEQIRRAVVRYKETGRPIVVSMSNVAASGGYWISMNADRILAHATTITGSIGVFGLIPTFEEGLQRLGIHSDGVGTTQWSGNLSPARGLSAEAKQGIQLLVEKDYRQFISRVAEARNLSVDAVDAVAQGQVWTGEAAMQHGLVDEIGDFDAAVSAAAELAKLKDFEIQPVLPPVDIRVRFLGRFSLLGQLLPTGLQSVVNDWSRRLDGVLRRWSDPQGVYVHCLCVP